MARGSTGRRSPAHGNRTSAAAPPADFGPWRRLLDRNAPLLFQTLRKALHYFKPVTLRTRRPAGFLFTVEAKAWGHLGHSHRRSPQVRRRRRATTVSLARFASAAYKSHDPPSMRRSGSRRSSSRRPMPSSAKTSTRSSDPGIAERNGSSVHGAGSDWPVDQHAGSSQSRRRGARILERIRRGERVEHFETVRRRKDGTLLDISLFFLFSHPRCTGTDRGRVEDRARHWRAQAGRTGPARADRRKNEFLVDAGPRLRNPLARSPTRCR